MLANNVQESSTTSGAGNFTLSGSSENGRTFSSQYSVNHRFTYIIYDGVGNFETGVGHLSDSTTLVRESPQDGSSSLPVNFGAGEKQVFVGASRCNAIDSSPGFSDLGTASKLCKPENIINGTNRNSSVNEVVFIPSLFSRCFKVDLLGVIVASGAAPGNMYAGIYDKDPDTGLPGNLLVETTSIDPSSTGFVSGTIPETEITPGWHWLALWSDVSVSLRSSSGSNLISNPFMLGSSSGLSNAIVQQNASGLTSLPSVAAPTFANVVGSSFNYVVLGHT